MQDLMKVITYRGEYREAFRMLNLHWIEKYFKVEEKDLEQVNNPEVCLQEGGQIFFILFKQKAVGTCALYKITDKKFELAKMAVDPEFQGCGLGDLLMLAAEKWAHQQGATEIMLLSNTLLGPAINLYKKHGYRTFHSGQHPDYDRCNIGMIKSIE